MSKSINLFIVIFLLSLTACGVNYSAQKNATKTPKSQLEFKAMDLPEELNEISGLYIDDDSFWGFNDSGGEAAIYKVKKDNPSKISQTIYLENAKNVDWETMAISDSLVFIGDTGNNVGNRKDLKIYYFNKNQIQPDVKEQSVSVKELSFFYPEQTNYSNQIYNHNFDLEAMFFMNGKLHVFTKEWDRKKTKHYTLDLVDGKQAAWRVEEFDAQFLITGADAFWDGKQYQISWVGYTRKGQVFWLKTKVDKEATQFFNKAIEVIPLGLSTKLGQVEGVAYDKNGNVCFSAEAFNLNLIRRKQNVTCISQK